MRLTKRRLIIACLVILAIPAIRLLLPAAYLVSFVCYVIFREAFLSTPNVSEQQLKLAVKKLSQRGYMPGMYYEVPLPTSLRTLTPNGMVDVLKTKDGRTIVLFRTFHSAKGNYRGVLYSDAPFKSSDEGVDPFGRTAIMLDRSSTTIETRVNPQYFVVYADYG